MAALLLQLLLPEDFFLAMLVHLCWGPVAQSLVRPLPVDIELQVGIDPSSGLGDGLVSFQIHLLVLRCSATAAPQRCLSRYLPLPSMLTWTLCSCNVWVKASLVN